MITENRIEESIRRIEESIRVGIFILFKVLHFILFKILHIEAAVVVTLLWGITYLLVYFISGKDSGTAIYTDFIFILYPFYVTYKDSVGLYRWLYQKKN